MFWLRSSACQVRPPSSERYSPFFGGSASMNAYTTSGFEGATATATRPHGLVGNPAVPGALKEVLGPVCGVGGRGRGRRKLGREGHGAPPRVALGDDGAPVARRTPRPGLLRLGNADAAGPVADRHRGAAVGDPVEGDQHRNACA